MTLLPLPSLVAWLAIVMLDSCLGNKSDIFYHNNENNQLERQVRPPRETIRCPVMDSSIPLE